jgi:hypothetical protein
VPFSREHPARWDVYRTNYIAPFHNRLARSQFVTVAQLDAGSKSQSEEVPAVATDLEGRIQKVSDNLTSNCRLVNAMITNKQKFLGQLKSADEITDELHKFLTPEQTAMLLVIIERVSATHFYCFSLKAMMIKTFSSSWT